MRAAKLKIGLPCIDLGDVICEKGMSCRGHDTLTVSQKSQDKSHHTQYHFHYSCNGCNTLMSGSVLRSIRCVRPS